MSAVSISGFVVLGGNWNSLWICAVWLQCDVWLTGGSVASPPTITEGAVCDVWLTGGSAASPPTITEGAVWPHESSELCPLYRPSRRRTAGGRIFLQDPRPLAAVVYAAARYLCVQFANQSLYMSVSRSSISGKFFCRQPSTRKIARNVRV